MKKRAFAKIAIVCAVVVVLSAGGTLVCWKVNKMKGFGSGYGSKCEKACKEIGPDWAFYRAKSAKLSFCYNTAWGNPIEQETTVDKENRVGTEFDITFDKLGWTLAQAAPMVSISTPDFELTGPTDGLPFDWSLDFTLPQAELYKNMGLKNIKAMLDKRFVNGKISLKITKNYYDSAFDYKVDLISNYVKAHKYNLIIGAGSKYSTDLETMVSSVRF